MFWYGMILALILVHLPKVWSEWVFRLTVIASIVANLVVGILSGTRRRSAPRWWRALVGEVAKGLLWLAYEGGEKATESALGKVSLSDSDASEQEKQVVAFWATFLLLHLGGPDNLSAYSLQDNTMSKRKVFEAIFRVAGAIFTIYNNTHRGGRSWALLLAASVIMLVAGAVRYAERAQALGKANLESMQEDASSTSSEQGEFGTLKCKITRAKRRSRGRSICDGEALLLAQDLFPIWRHALVDSSVDSALTSPRQQASEMILSSEWGWNWESMCNVAEMELSLIYELLYTKAILARTWYYYLIRLLSPLFTAAAAVLFCSWHHHQQQQGAVRGSFVRITYAMLAITFLMDVAWLLRALGSTWAYAYFQAAGRSWSWWCRIHRVVVWLDPLQLLGIDPVSYRRWSGTIGRYNLLDECIARSRNKDKENLPKWWPVSAAGDDKPKELRYLSKLPPCVKEMVFKRVTKILQEAIDTEETEFGEAEGDSYTRVDIRTRWGHKAFHSARRIQKVHDAQEEFREKKVNPFGQEFEEDVLLWHIATCMLLLLTEDDVRDAPQKGTRRAIEVMSEYMMFLVAVRPKMLPGLALHSQLQATRNTLDKALESLELIPGYEKSKMNNKEDLAKILRFARNVEPHEQLPVNQQIVGNEGTKLLVHAVDIYFCLTGEERPTSTETPWSRRRAVVVSNAMLKIIFNVWVDKMVYAAVRCSREAHAEQLSKGGDLTTVLWMLIQHAGPFYIQKAANLTFAKPSATAVPPAGAPPLGTPQPVGAPPLGTPQPVGAPPLGTPPPWVVGAPPPPWGTAPPPLVGAPPLGTDPTWGTAPPPATAPTSDTEVAPAVSPHDQPFPPVPMHPPPPCPVCPPYYYPSWDPVCPPPYYNPSCPPVCPWYPHCTLQHERPEEEPKEDKEDEHEDSSSSSEDSESEE